MQFKRKKERKPQEANLGHDIRERMLHATLRSILLAHRFSSLSVSGVDNTASCLKSSTAALGLARSSRIEIKTMKTMLQKKRESQRPCPPTKETRWLLLGFCLYPFWTGHLPPIQQQGLKVSNPPSIHWWITTTLTVNQTGHVFAKQHWEFRWRK